MIITVMSAVIVAAVILFPDCHCGKTSPGEIPVPWATLAWHHTKLDEAAVSQRANVRVMNLDVATSFATIADEGLAETTTKPQKYTLLNLNDARYQPLCKAFFVRVNNLHTATCSCAFVGPRLVVLAAHCFTTHGAAANQGMSVYVVQQYGIKGADIDQHLDYIADHHNYATEWWYPASYSRPPGVKPEQYAGSGYDLAFIRTKDASVGNAHYRLTPPDGKIGAIPYDLTREAVAVLGYPGDFRKGQLAVAFEGKLTRYPHNTPADMFCVEGKDVTDYAKQRDMGAGGSGGPWILTDAALKGKLKPLATDLRMALFGVYSYGPLYSTAGTGMAIFMRTGCGLRVTEQVQKIAGKIDSFKSPMLAKAKNGDMVTTAGGDVVTKVDADVETVLFKL